MLALFVKIERIKNMVKRESVRVMTMRTWLGFFLLLAMTGCAQPEPANQDYPDPGALSCIETWETSREIIAEAHYLDKLGSGEPLDRAITASRVNAYKNKLDSCEAELNKDHHVDGFRQASVLMKLGQLEEYIQENPYNFDN